MIVEQFWDLIDRSRELAKGALQEQGRHLQALLEELPASEILAFDKIYLGYAKLSYRATLWAALYIKEGGCSDDAFDYCRYELIARGRAAMETLVRDPDRLADAAYEDLCGDESIRSAIRRAYEKIAGTDAHGYREALRKLPAFDLGAEYARLGLDPGYNLNVDPVMRLDFDNRDAMSKLVPKVWKRYGRP